MTNALQEGTIAYVGFGANLGDPARTLRDAVSALGLRAGAVEAGSRIYRSRPIGPTDQPDFRNAVARVCTPFTADRLLDELLAIEAGFGRVRELRWGPRTLDLDLIWYGGQERDDARLVLPHPRAHEREFVLRPLAELAPGLVLRGATVTEWLDRLEPQGVEATPDVLM